MEMTDQLDFNVQFAGKQKLNPQALRILKKLQEYEGRFVPLPEILSMFIGSYTRRITEIRRAGYNVELKDERVNGQRHTAYRLVA
jgi:Txe/YoeB family toxin of Txe-Axe toxin-antitoxin module